MSTNVTLQPFGALLVLDAECRELQAYSDNAFSLLTPALNPSGVASPACLLGKRLSQRVRLELNGHQRLPGPLAFTRHCQGKSERFQLFAYRHAEHVIVEVEPLNPLGKRRLIGTVNERLMRLAEATHQEDLLEMLVNAIQALTGHDRVSVCHFDSDWHGLVVAEAMGGSLAPLLGQRFPASDFPISLRRSYERQSVRLIQDVEAMPVPLKEASGGYPSADAAIRESLLRAPASSRQRYLQRMGVRGSLSIAMHGDTGLWGIVVCHSAAAHPVPPAVRDAVRTLVHMATQRLLLLRARQEARYLQRVQDSLGLAEAMRDEPRGPHALLAAQAETWLALFRAHGVMLWLPDAVHSVGHTPAVGAIHQLVERLNTAHPHRGPWCTREVSQDPLTAQLDMPQQSGVLAIPLPMSRHQRAWLMFFRPEQTETLYWAMQPTSMLTPTLSASDSRSTAWQEEVVGKSEAWQRVERLAAMDLGEDLTLAIAAYEISTLNQHLEQERKALADANQRLEQLAHFDPLTQVWNRYRIEQAIAAELVAAKRYGTCFALLLFDIDDFKQINDTYGHTLGDDVLVSMARRIEASLRGCDHLGRWGGEEFIVLATHSELSAAVGLAERLRELVTMLNVDGLDKTVTISVGVAVWQPEDSAKTMVTRADSAMYQAKHGGRNRVEVAR
ncbi:sensor domain-containing diguanylate cyclase [Vreelandella arcis]|uniref:diguanylate cyclase n=1 Tax=Vreelandella arcis TaxID=416873 RepID=A0A1H0AUG9_9GAMM|nr:sensor domain-containing diguanylate cyclase [Halomonas arcis]SDN37150.1 diguanylate cyclase (GGDEF) domain-containing protein [Halomonas arcis]